MTHQGAPVIAVADSYPEAPSESQKARTYNIKCHHNSCRYTQTKHVSNPLLCQSCQPWDDFTHVVFCQDPIYPRIDSEAFNPRHDSAERKSSSSIEYYIHRLANLQFRSPRFYSSEKSCIICSFIGKLLQDTGSIHDGVIGIGLWRPFPFNYVKPYLLEKQSQDSQPMTEQCILPICLKLESQKGESATFQPLILEVELQYATLGHGLQQIRVWDRRYCDTAALKDWLSECRTCHDENCNTQVAATLPPGFRLIDTTLRCVVQPQGAEEFAVLSYQWKTATAHADRDIMLTEANLEELETPGSLQDGQVPEVVIDAMQLCSDIGCRYLWVDRFCIIQDNDTLKTAQIQAMDVIYQSALAAIVACADGIGAGLPGVSTRSRPLHLENKYWNFGVDGDHVGATASAVHEVVESSAWNGRAWTYQERVLSRRHIFFGNDHVHLSCFHDSDNLETRAKAQVDRGQGIRSSFSGMGFETGLRHDEAYFGGFFGLYSRTTREYTPRALSYRTDILNAFSGVLNTFCSLSKTNSLQGIPERYLSQGILWGYLGNEGPETGQSSIPSWSWASWKGSCVYHSVVRLNPLTYQHVTSRSHFGNLVSIFYCDLVGSPRPRLRPLVEDRLWFNRQVLVAGTETSIESQILGNTANRMRGGKDPVGLWTSFLHGPLEALAHCVIDEQTQSRAELHPHSLVFNTTLAVLRLDVMAEEYEQSDRQDDGQYIRLGMYGEEGSLVGETAIMHKDFVQRTFMLGESYHVFVLGASHMGKLNEPIFRSGTHPLYRCNQPWALFVMIASRRDYLYSRLTIGVVTPATWTTVNPRWEPVILV